MPYCMHPECRCHAVEELFFIARRLLRPQLSARAVVLHKSDELVHCRHVPRKGPIQVPLPGMEA